MTWISISRQFYHFKFPAGPSAISVQTWMLHWMKKSGTEFFSYQNTQQYDNDVTVKDEDISFVSGKRLTELCQGLVSKARFPCTQFTIIINPHNPCDKFFYWLEFSGWADGTELYYRVIRAHLHHKSYLYSLFVHLKKKKMVILIICKSVCLQGIVQLSHPWHYYMVWGQMLNKDIWSFWNSCFTLFMH